MDVDFKIYIDRVKNKEEKISLKCSSKDLEILNEKDLKIQKPIEISGKAYLANDKLILNLSIKYFISIPCSICNEFTEKMIKIKNFYHMTGLEETNAIYDYKKDLRNVILLEIPSYVECNEKCSKRNDISKYLKKDNVTNYYPFSKLN